NTCWILKGLHLASVMIDILKDDTISSVLTRHQVIPLVSSCLFVVGLVNPTEVKIFKNPFDTVRTRIVKIYSRITPVVKQDVVNPTPSSFHTGSSKRNHSDTCVSVNDNMMETVVFPSIDRPLNSCILTPAELVYPPRIGSKYRNIMDVGISRQMLNLDSFGTRPRNNTMANYQILQFGIRRTLR